MTAAKARDKTSGQGQKPPDAEEARQQRLADGAACLEAALDYLGRGWSVLAVCPPDHAGVGKTHGKNCQSPGKAPWGPWREYQGRLPTSEAICCKWHENPTLNVGLALGPVSGLVRVDVDGPAGEQRLLEVSKGDLPPTLEFTSGRTNGGRGLLYTIPPGAELRTTVEKPGQPKQELRFQAKGAQTVLPPSRHPEGNLYTWVQGRGLGEIEPAPAPPWLLEQLRPDRGGASKGRAKPLAEGEAIKEGYRDTTLTSFAGTMRRRDMTYEAIRAALLAENEARCEPPLSEDQVDKIARSVSGYKPGPDRGPKIEQAKPQPHDFTLGNLTLQPGPARHTKAGKLVLSVSLFKGGDLIDRVPLSDSACGRKQAAAQIGRHLGHDPAALAEVERVITQVIVAAVQTLDQLTPQTEGGVFGLVRARVPEVLQLTHRTSEGKLWSEAKAVEMTRADFITFTPALLLEEAARLFPSGGMDPLECLPKVEAALKVLWAELHQQLPGPPEANLDGKSADAHRFRAAFVRLWTAPQTWEVTRKENAEVTSRASLISRARSQIRACQRGGRPHWQEIQPACHAWWRLHEKEDGEQLPLLAMRHELTDQVKVNVPGIHDLESLKVLGVRYGLIDGKPPVPTVRNGKERLAVLAEGITRELLDTPCEWEDEAES